MDEGESIHNTVQFSPVTNANQTLDLVDRPIFNVVIFYEDSAAGKRAKHFYNSVNRKLLDECDFSLELWNFQVLAFPDIGNSAAEAAARADIVIFSMHRKARLSFHTSDWIERWSGLIGDDRSALVALLDQPGMSRGTVASTLDYLRKIADRKGISFYTHILLVFQQTRKDPIMSSWTHSVQANEMAHFSTTRTLSDFPLLIGEMLRRGNLRAWRQARRRTLIRKIKTTFGIP